MSGSCRQRRKVKRLVQQYTKPKYRSVISHIPIRHRTLLALLVFLLLTAIYTYLQVKYSDKLADCVLAALIEHVFFNEG